MDAKDVVEWRLAEKLEKMDEVRMPAKVALNLEAPDGNYSMCMYQRDENGELVLNEESSRMLTRNIRTIPGYMPGLTLREVKKALNRISKEEHGKD